MNKLMIPASKPATFFNILGVLLFAIFFSFPCAAADGEDHKQVVFVRYNLKEDSHSSVVEAFKKTMAKRGYQEGINIDYIDFVTHSPERDSAEEVLNITEKYMPNADLFVTSSWTSLYVRSKLAKSNVPQLFAPALKSTALNMLPSVKKEPETNLSGVYLMYPPEKILRLTRLILPTAQKYAFVYDSRIPADIIFKAAYGQLNDHERHGTTIYYLDLASGTDSVIQKMNKMEIEVFGGAIGMFKNLEELSKSNLPIITALMFDRHKNALTKSIKESNIVAGLFNPFDICGTKAAEMAADIFDQKTTIEKTIPRPAEQHAVINLHSAKRLAISIPFSALEAVDIVIK